MTWSPNMEGGALPSSVGHGRDWLSQHQIIFNYIMLYENCEIVFFKKNELSEGKDKYLSLDIFFICLIDNLSLYNSTMKFWEVCKLKK